MASHAGHGGAGLNISQAKSAWNPVYKAPGTLCICACESSGVFLQFPRSSLIPCPGEGRGEGWSAPLRGCILSSEP